MNKFIVTFLTASMFFTTCNQPSSTSKGGKQVIPADFIISKATLMDKIKGGWAGQTIGCTYGGPTEFKFRCPVNISVLLCPSV